MGSYTFLFPYVLFGLLLLPLIWLLLRVLPPAPKRIRFPAMMLLRDLQKTESPSHKTPWWLLLLRVTALAFFIFAVAEPITRMADKLSDGVSNNNSPVLLLIDNDWISAQNWQQRQEMSLKLVERIHRSGRNVIVLPTASPNRQADVISSEAAKAIVLQIEPHSWSARYKTIIETVQKLTKQVDTIWLTSGYHSFVSGKMRTYKDSDTYNLLISLQEMGKVTIVDAGSDEYFPSLVKLEPVSEKQKLTLSLHRLTAPTQNIPTTVIMYGKDGHVLGQQKLSFPIGELKVEKTFNISAENRNKLSKLKIQQSSNAGGVFLVDENWRFRPVGVATTEKMLNNQGYLNDVFYMVRALEPYVDLHTGTVKEMLDGKKLAVLLLSDDYPLTREERNIVKIWVNKGGMLIRFAGPNLAENVDNDNLLPVELRYGGRNFAGNMTWDTPQLLGDFSEAGPFAGIVMSDETDVTVSKQVLAKPSLEMEKKIWARLEDNTPLITGRQEGNGYLVLFHTTANPEWSSLSLSGVFIETLRKLIDLSSGVTGLDGQEARLLPVKMLDGFGRFQVPNNHVMAIENQKDFKIDFNAPPGFYGQGDVAKAFNLIDYTDLPNSRIIDGLPDDVMVIPYAKGGETTYKPHLAVIALILLLIDFMISLYLRGIFFQSAKAVLVALLISGFMVSPANAAEKYQDAIKYTTNTWIAYVETGDTKLDKISKQGLGALQRLISRRTSATVKGVTGVDVENDILTYFPFIYWPVTNQQAPISVKAQENILSYMRNGGMILFDTRDAKFGQAGKADTGRGAEYLKTLLQNMPIPALQPVPQKHVLTRSYYLLRDFPGRYKGAELWIEKHPAANHDNVPSIMIGGNDWAAAWARKDNGQSVYQIPKGGERQREMAFRFGINVIMMSLTGNYKVDQIHTKELLKRMGDR